MGVGVGVVSGQWALSWCNEAWPPAVAHPATAPVCLPTLSRRTHNQLDSSAIFAAINAIWLERKSIRRVYLWLRVEGKIFCRGIAEKPQHQRFRKMFCDVSLY